MHLTIKLPCYLKRNSYKRSFLSFKSVTRAHCVNTHSPSLDAHLILEEGPERCNIMRL
ncbi:hypothetical protein HanIR_Chr12g0574071 [Helianthus annuus]|nr:hypothetical protein HanIR_Chr12g0574071 [Helianthus annuus]